MSDDDKQSYCFHVCIGNGRFVSALLILCLLMPVALPYLSLHKLCKTLASCHGIKQVEQHDTYVDAWHTQVIEC